MVTYTLTTARCRVNADGSIVTDTNLSNYLSRPIKIASN